MFEFITISDGIVIVQHAPTGFVYRFRPARPGLWHALTLHTIDVADTQTCAPEDYSEAALFFATHAVASLCHQAATSSVLEQSKTNRHLSQRWRRSRSAVG